MIDFRHPITTSLGLFKKPSTKNFDNYTVKFEADAWYSDEKNKKVQCECDCCRFEQYVIRLRMSSTHPNMFPEKDWRTPGEKRAQLTEDCVWWKISDEVDGAPPAPDKQHRTSVTPRPNDGVPTRLVCYGQAGGGDGVEDRVKEVKTECTYWMCDSPSFSHVNLGGFTSHDLIFFVGQIVDVCNNRKVKRRDAFAIKVTMTGAGAEARWSQGPNLLGPGIPLPLTLPPLGEGDGPCASATPKR
jgi:hypothetical protein